MKCRITYIKTSCYQKKENRIRAFSGILRQMVKDSPAAAKAFVTDLTEKLLSLARNGVSGSSRDWISMNLQAFPYRERCFYFRIVDDAMVVVRILHGKQDITSQEFPYDS